MANEPITREEKYLAYLTGTYTEEIPKPITRTENYLDYTPEKSVEQQLKEQREELETQKLLIQYVAEMGDIYIPE